MVMELGDEAWYNVKQECCPLMPLVPSHVFRAPYFPIDLSVVKVFRFVIVQGVP